MCRTNRFEDEFKYTLRGLLIVLLLASILFAILGYHVHRSEKVKAAREYYDRIGTFYLDHVGTGLDLTGKPINDDQLELLPHLPELRALLLRGSPIGDASLKYIGQCDELAYVDLRETNVSETGAKKLQSDLPQCVIDW